MRNKFDEQLEALHIELIKMGCLCETAIANASKSLQNAVNPGRVIETTSNLLALA